MTGNKKELNYFPFADYPGLGLPALRGSVPPSTLLQMAIQHAEDQTSAAELAPPHAAVYKL